VVGSHAVSPSQRERDYERYRTGVAPRPKPKGWIAAAASAFRPRTAARRVEVWSGYDAAGRLLVSCCRQSLSLLLVTEMLNANIWNQQCWVVADTADALPRCSIRAVSRAGRAELAQREEAA
jgi:hypothetical protein